MKQRSEEWLLARVGCATASRFKDILATIKTGEAAARRNYRAQLVCERMTGVPYPSFETAEMRFGTEQEPFARMAYEAHMKCFVEEVGFIRHPEIMAGCSPDGLIGDEGTVEFKVPNTATHIETLMDGRVPSEHMPQIMGQLWITGRQWCHFVSFDPRMPQKLQLFVQRIERDEEIIEKLEKEVRKFLVEVDKRHQELLTLAEAA